MKISTNNPATNFAKKALKSLTMTAMVLCAVSFVACSDDDDEGEKQNGTDSIRKIEVKGADIKGVPMDTDIKTVKAVLYSGVALDIELATAPWEYGFTIELPETVSSSYLSPVKEEFDDEELTVSSNAKFARVDLEVYDGEGDYLEDIIFGRIWNGKDGVWGYNIYSDADCKVTGTVKYGYEDYIETYVYDIDFKKGWNRLYNIEKEIDEDNWEFTRTTTTPSGIVWVWGEIY
ncbi:MAG: hypothetical protein LIO85_01555 [Rikenellaceae bacterium]|nr:hypothetical protein [Rikenellaceae bacterium]